MLKGGREQDKGGTLLEGVDHREMKLKSYIILSIMWDVT